ncbi:hypothetical protein NL676_029581 [Syzygium grande]|nr:hypothetical protein NL676_029581 [Syzygium grande]
MDDDKGSRPSRSEILAVNQVGSFTATTALTTKGKPLQILEPTRGYKQIEDQQNSIMLSDEDDDEFERPRWIRRWGTECAIVDGGESSP